MLIRTECSKSESIKRKRKISPGHILVLAVEKELKGGWLVHYQNLVPEFKQKDDTPVCGNEHLSSPESSHDSKSSPQSSSLSQTPKPSLSDKPFHASPSAHDKRIILGLNNVSSIR